MAGPDAQSADDPDEFEDGPPAPEPDPANEAERRYGHDESPA